VPTEQPLQAKPTAAHPADDNKNDSTITMQAVVFENIPLDSIIKEIAYYHHLDIELQNEEAKQLRFYFVWKQDDNLQEVIEKLNMFEHVNTTVENNKLIVK
jgi:ferric-dicitrate binding protein FerR (iron transport regulator)